MEEEDGVRTRSFRFEDYNNRRVFLRSYPLHWSGEEDEQEEEQVTTVSKEGKRGVKGRVSAVLQLAGGKALLLRKLKNKVAFYLVACRPFRFKPTTSLLSV